MKTVQLWFETNQTLNSFHFSQTLLLEMGFSQHAWQSLNGCNKRVVIIAGEAKKPVDCQEAD